GDSGQISSSAVPSRLGLITSIDTGIGGADTIATGSGDDIVIGGAAGDTIGAGEGNNTVFGDSGLIDYAARERGGLLAGDDSDPSDVDRIWSLTSGVGGPDTITTGAGDDTILGGADADTIDAGN